MIAQYIPLAERLAARYSRRGERDDDLRQVACLGLIKAVDRFDPERGTAFAAFATPTILGEIRRHFRQMASALHAPRGLQELALAVRRIVPELEGELGRAPSPGEVAERADASVEEVLEALAYSDSVVPESSDAAAIAGEATGLYDLVGDEDPAYREVEERTTIAPFVRALSEEQREVLTLRFYADLSQAEIARRIGRSQMHVSRLLRRTLAGVRSDVFAEAA